MIPKIPIKLDKERHLLLDLRAVASFEFSTGKAIFPLSAIQNLSVTETMLLLWACLRHEDEKLSPTDILQIIETHKINGNKIGKKLFQAWVECVTYLAESLNGR